MTVLPNAPIDPVTGLPRPTIAVATIGGTCILRDDDNTVLDSRIIKTDVISGVSNLTKQRLKRMLKARLIGESPLPLVASNQSISNTN